MQHATTDYLALRETIRSASGETIDLKACEGDMRHLLDTYIQADPSRKISPFEEIGLMELIVSSGIGEAIATRLGSLRGNKEAIAETIKNNVRSKIIKEHLSDPAFYERMSALLDEIIAARKAIEYEEFLRRIAALAKTVQAGKTDNTSTRLDTQEKLALCGLLEKIQSRSPVQPASEVNPFADGLPTPEALALRIDESIYRVRPSDWRGNLSKERVIQAAIYEIVQDEDQVMEIFQRQR